MVLSVVVRVMDDWVLLAIQSTSEMDWFVNHLHPDRVLSNSCSASAGTFLI